MNKKISSILLIAFVLTVGIPTIESKNPLVGSMELQYNLGWPAPQAEIPDWVGHITINGEVYGMVFYNIGNGKPDNNAAKGPVVFFGEIWVIFESIDFTFDENGILTNWDHGPVLLSGTDEGIVTLKNSNYHMNGIVDEANGIFQNWLYRNVHMSGEILWYPFGAPLYAPGAFRIN